MSELYKEPFGLHPDNLALLGIAFPGVPVYRNQIPPFTPDPVVILFSEKEPPPIKAQIIHVKRVAEWKLDSREGWIRFLKSRGVKLSKDTEGALLVLDEDEFWRLTKIGLIIKMVPSQALEESASTFLLFKHLFGSFTEKLKLYHNMSTHHKVLFSSLLTMMLKTQNLDSPGISAGYKKVLMMNKTGMPAFKKAVLSYVETAQTEMDFISFLLELSGKRV